MIFENAELVRTNINRIICNNQNWEKTVKENLTHFLNDTEPHYEFLKYLYDDLSKQYFIGISHDAQVSLMKFGLPKLADGEYKTWARDFEIVSNLINNYSNNLIIQYCVYLVLKNWYDIEQAKTSTMNGYIASL